jgi:diguanylate cyclase (GGDEF)-like protein
VQARTDPLTGLMNRDAILAELHARLDDRRRPTLAVLYIDLDRFKVVNDVLGHGAGDQVLVSAARRMRAAVGTDGLIARFGGDEFLVVCTTGDDPTLPEAPGRRDPGRVRERFRFGEEFSITASIGIARAPRRRRAPATADPERGRGDVRQQAPPRNGWQGSPRKLARRSRQRLQLETHLRRALDNEEFHLVYQPQVDLRSGRWSRSRR